MRLHDAGFVKASLQSAGKGGAHSNPRSLLPRILSQRPLSFQRTPPDRFTHTFSSAQALRVLPTRTQRTS